MTHHRLRPSTLRALAVWLRLALLTLVVLVMFIIAAYGLAGELSWE